MVKLELSVSEMLKLVELLEGKLSRAHSSKQIDFIEKQIEVIYGILSVAVFNTAQEAIPQIKRALDSSIVNREMLMLVIGEKRVNALPKNGQLELFAEAEDVTEKVNEDLLKDELWAILKKSFVQNIPTSISTYRKLTNSKEPDHVVWFKIRDLFPENGVFKLWDKHLAKTLIEAGPVKAFYEIKKHFKEWDDVDVSIVLDKSAKAGLPALKDKENATEAYLNKILNFGPHHIREYMGTKEDVDTLSRYEGINEKTHVGRRMKQILDVCCPEKRTEILKRKEYIEKGY